MIRPALVEKFGIWSEVIAAGGVIGLGLWLVSLGGWVLQPFGLLVAALGGGWALIGWRRMHFRHAVEGPGLVELDEGEIRYFGAGHGLGGTIALADITELRLIRMQGTQHWRLRARAGHAVVIPVAAAGAEVLYDAFSVLPRIDMGRVTAGLARDLPAQSLWIRQQAPDADQA